MLMFPYARFSHARVLDSAVSSLSSPLAAFHARSITPLARSELRMVITPSDIIQRLANVRQSPRMAS